MQISTHFTTTRNGIVCLLTCSQTKVNENNKQEASDLLTREGILRKNKVAASVFSKLCYTPMFLIYFPLNEITKPGQHKKVLVSVR